MRWGDRIKIMGRAAMNHKITIRLGPNLVEWLSAKSAQTGLSQSRIIRDELEKAKAGNFDKSFMLFAGAIRGPRNLSTRKGFSQS